MKKIVITSLLLALAVVTNASPKKILYHTHKKNVVLANTTDLATVTTIKNNSANKSICRVTCTVTGTDQFGNIHTVTASAGSIFRTCETAGELACKAAYDALEYYVSQEK